MEIPADLKYTKDHEWIRVSGEYGLIGITAYAQNQLGDIVLVEMPNLNDTLKKGDSFGVVESVKTVSDLYAPVSGTVVESNSSLCEAPEIINEDPYNEGWMVKLKIAAPHELDALMTPEQYQHFLQEEGL